MNIIYFLDKAKYEKEKHLQRKTINLDKKVDIEEENPDNYGHQDEYLGNDFLDTFLVDNFKKEDNEEMIKTAGIYMEISNVNTDKYERKNFILMKSLVILKYLTFVFLINSHIIIILIIIFIK